MHAYVERDILGWIFFEEGRMAMSGDIHSLSCCSVNHVTVRSRIQKPKGFSLG
jgi:hypothetical protein